MPLRRAFDALVTTCGAACLALGASVLVGAGAGIALLRRPVPFGVATAPETAACFVALGAALLLRRRRFVAPLLALLPGLLAAVRVVGYARAGRAGPAGAIDLYPAQMAPNAAVALLAAAIAISLLSTHRWRDARTTVASVLGAQVLAISGTALLGYVVHLESAYGWGGRPPVAFPSAVALSLIAVALIAWAWSEAGRIREASWPGWSAASFGVAFTVFLWQALETQDAAHVRATLLLDAQAAAREIRSALTERAALVERAARRITRANGAGWDDEAALLRQSVEGLVGVGWRGPDGRLRWSGAAGAPAVAEIGAATAFSDARTGELIVSAPLVPGDPSSGMVAAAFDVTAVFDSELDVAPDSCLVVLHAGREVYRRACASRRLAQDFIAEADTAPGESRWSARVWASPQLLTQADSPLPDVVLAAGLTISGLLFAAIRLAQRAAARATEAEARVRSEAALRESEERYRRLFERNPQAIVVVDEDTLAILAVNEAAVREYGWSREEFAAMRVCDLWTPADLPAYESRFRASRGAPRPNLAARHVRRDGSQFDVEVQAHTVVFNGREARLGVMTDVTERQRSERALRASEERFRALVENSADGVVVLDREGVVRYGSPATARLLGWVPEELLGRSAFMLSHRDDHAVIESTLAETARRPGKPVPVTARILCRDGSFRVFDCVVTNRTHEPSVRGLVVNYRDITDRQEAEQALRLRDRAIENISQALVVIDVLEPGRPIVHVNRGFERITGYPAAQALGRSARFLAGKDTDLAAVQALGDAIVRGAAAAQDVLLYRADGTPVWTSVAVTPVAGPDGRTTHYVGLATDITERRRLEEQYRQAQKMEAVGQLAGGIAHDFNNLLSVILGYAEVVLRRLGAGDPLRAKVDEIRKAGQRAAGLTRQLLAFGRKQVLNPTLIDLGAVLADLAPMLRRLLGEDVTLGVEVPPELGVVKADRGQIEQVVLNLAVNARDAMSEGGPLVIGCRDVHMRAPLAAANREIPPGDYVELTVTDTGTGMDAATVRRIFEPFFTTKEVGKGTGLGLATTYGIVEQSGGYIKVTTAPGRGSTFAVYLPRVDAPVEGPEMVTGDPLPRGSETILLVEDEEAVRSLAANVLTDLGYHVLRAADGADALGVADAARRPIDALVTDVIMPIMNGRELAARLRARLDGKVLYMSGHSDDAIARHGVLEQGTRFIQKPFTPETLARAVRELLDQVGDDSSRASMSSASAVQEKSRAPWPSPVKGS